MKKKHNNDDADHSHSDVNDKSNDDDDDGGKEIVDWDNNLNVNWDDNDEDADQIAAEREVVWLKAKPLKGRTRMNKISIRSRLIIAILPGLVLMVRVTHLDKMTCINDDGLTR